MRTTIVEFRGEVNKQGKVHYYLVFSTRKKQLIKPHSKKKYLGGKQWRDFYYLLPGIYFVFVYDINERGVHNCHYKKLVVEDGEWRFEDWIGYPPRYTRFEICECMR